MSALGVWLQWIVTALCLVLTATSVLFALIWAPRLAYRRLRGGEPPFSRASLARRFQPLAALLVLAVSCAVFGFGMADPIRRLGTPTLYSVSFAAGTLIYAVLTLASAAQWWRTRGEAGVSRGVRVHSLLVNLAQIVIVVALASWSLLGLRSWT